MAPLTVVYDATVLYPAPLRDLLMRVALTDVIRARWTTEIHAEWMHHILATRPDLTRVQLERTRALMDAHVRDCLVEGAMSIATRTGGPCATSPSSPSLASKRLLRRQMEGTDALPADRVTLDIQMALKGDGRGGIEDLVQ